MSLYDNYSDEPNENPERTVARCRECDSAIEIGDKYIDIDGDFYCECCIDDMTKSNLLELVGISMQTADFE